MYYATREFVRSCVDCQRHESTQTGPLGLMNRRIVEKPWVVVSADCLEFPMSTQRHTHLLVFQDLFTRWVELIPLRRITGKAVSRAFEELILLRWDIPYYLLTDNGPEFSNQFLAKTCKDYGVKWINTPPYHPQANLVER